MITFIDRKNLEQKSVFRLWPSGNMVAILKPIYLNRHEKAGENGRNMRLLQYCLEKKNVVSSCQDKRELPLFPFCLSSSFQLNLSLFSVHCCKGLFGIIKESKFTKFSKWAGQSRKGEIFLAWHLLKMHACETVIMGTLLLRRESLLVYRVSKHSGWMYCSLTSEKHSAPRYAFWNWLIYIRKLDFKTRESRKRKANSERGSLALVLTPQTIIIFQSWSFLFLITFVQKKGCWYIHVVSKCQSHWP